MKFYEVAPTKIIRAGSATFTYASAEPLAVGLIVTIPVGSKELVGVIIRQVEKPSYDTKEITSVIEPRALPQPLVELALWLADYYHTPLATVFQTVLPRGLTKTRRVRKVSSHTSVRERTQIVFTPDQTEALERIESVGSGTILLHGVTGSGKTEIYKEVARRAVARGESVIVLVPEISLTSQIIDEFSHDFPELLVTHSHMTEATRHLAWKEALESDKPRVVIGPRSALFLPVPNLSTIIIDEAHEPSYKQEQSPRYSALRAGSILAQAAGGKLILGSATPSVADWYLADAAKRPIISLTKRARDNATPPQLELIDMTKRDSFKRHRFLSDHLLRAIERNLESGDQTLIFHNRRGSASTTLCENCGWTAGCPHCFVPLVLHADAYRLSCHICGYNEKVPSSCPVCHSADIIHKGIGTKLIETELKRLFPKASIARFDSDTKDDQTIAERYQDLYDGTINIAIGTQVVAKGLDLPKLKTVGVIQADSGLAMPDFAASERTFQLLAQVVGRVGRDTRATELIIQSYQPTHPIIQFGIAQDYIGFYNETLEQRRRGHFPPFTYLLRLTTIYKSEAAAIRSARALAATLKSQLHPDVRLLGPTPAFYERSRDTYRWQLILKSPKREYLTAALDLVPRDHWQSELDPTSLL